MITDFDRRDLHIEARTMDHARGAWAGMRPQWWTATHLPSGFSVTWHDRAERSGHMAREAAITCLQMLVEEVQPAQPLEGRADRG